MIGVYFLRKGNKVVYVEQSVDIKTRVKVHKREGAKKFDNFTYIECDKELLNTTEEAFILQYNPIFNIQKAEFKVGIRPKPIDGKHITIRFTDEEYEEYEALKKASTKDERSINKYVVLAVKEKVKTTS